MRCCKLITGFPEVVFSSPWSYAQWTWEWMCWLSAVLLMAMVQEVAAALAPLPFFWLLQSLLWNFLSLLSYTCNLWPQIQPHILHETYCVCSQWTSYMLRDMHVLRALSPWELKSFTRVAVLHDQSVEFELPGSVTDVPLIVFSKHWI